MCVVHSRSQRGLEHCGKDPGGASRAPGTSNKCAVFAVNNVIGAIFIVHVYGFTFMILKPRCLSGVVGLFPAM